MYQINTLLPITGAINVQGLIIKKVIETSIGQMCSPFNGILISTVYF